MKNFQFSKYCTPAQLYLVLGAIGIIGAFFNNYSIETLLTNALFLVVWAWVLNWLCSKGFKAISWILVLLPFIMALFTYFLTKDVVAKEGFYEGFYEGLTDAEKQQLLRERNAEQAEINAKRGEIIAAQKRGDTKRAEEAKEALRQAEIAKKARENERRLAEEEKRKKYLEEQQAKKDAARAAAKK